MNNQNGDTQFSPEVCVLVGTLRPHCVDQHWWFGGYEV
jgi:hypothetical protein